MVLLLGRRLSRKEVLSLLDFEDPARGHVEDEAVDREQDAIKAFPISRPNGET